MTTGIQGACGMPGMPGMNTAAPAGGATAPASPALIVPGGDDTGAQLAGLAQALQALVAKLSSGQTAAAGAAAGASGLRAAVAADPGAAAAPAPAAPAAKPLGLPTPPAKGDPRFAAGSVGPTVPKGQAQTLKIPDGPGFGGAAGRKQNADDKTKNNFSVTDANFSNQLGILANDPDTGKPMTYVQHIQTYAAANYIEAYNHPLYEKLIANQNAGKGTILGAAANLMGLVKATDPALEGVTATDTAAIPAQIPGTPMDARAYVASGKDITGQDWARPHHAGSQFKALSGLIEAGVPWQDAMVLAGDDGISGAGRLNGVNTQDNTATGLNAGELDIFSKGAALQQQTGINVVELMMGGHNHLGGDPSALTNPKVNKIIGAAKTDRAGTPDRAGALFQSIVAGKVGGLNRAAKNGTNATNKKLLANAQGAAAPVQASALTATRAAVGGAAAGGAKAAAGAVAAAGVAATAGAAGATAAADKNNKAGAAAGGGAAGAAGAAAGAGHVHGA